MVYRINLHLSRALTPEDFLGIKTIIEKHRGIIGVYETGATDIKLSKIPADSEATIRVAKRELGFVVTYLHNQGYNPKEK